MKERGVERRGFEPGAIVVWGLRRLILLGALTISAAGGLMMLPIMLGAEPATSDGWRSVLRPFGLRLFVDPARLAIDHQQGWANEPLSLGIALMNGSGGEIVTISGLAEGSELSLGTQTGHQIWIVSANDLELTFVGAPNDFVGTMVATVELHSPAGRRLDSG